MPVNRRNSDLERRSRLLADGHRGAGPVVYWLSRDQRVRDNWALLCAQQEALIRGRGLVVVFCLVTDYPGGEQRSYQFLLTGLAELARRLAKLSIGFALLRGDPVAALPLWLHRIDACTLVGDFDPLRIKRQWQRRLLQEINVPFIEVDAHNVIPAWVASNKKEYAAATFRPKYRRLIDDYLTDIPPLIRHPHPGPTVSPLPETDRLLGEVAGRRATPVGWSVPGEAAGNTAIEEALKYRLPGYTNRRNDPCTNGQSGLSPYLHFGHISAQRLAWRVSQSELAEEDRQAFLEELLVRRELADNFCLHEPDYDRFSGFPAWAQQSLNEHRGDRRPYCYSLAELENAGSHEALWNACQRDLVKTGKLHGYLRMYWAKKILEWTSEPEEALSIAITLNDRYSLDGRDANGYTGIAWSIGGVHDRAWPRRPIFGKVRFMNEKGCRRKFAVDDYIAAVNLTHRRDRF
ncbi:MAG: deoxyribodipyrimidine photo-lyase [Desulfofustis sp.]|nr:deoxyribodipyrimidine photo-lyase [Desulfofustis sp.]